MSVTAPNWPNCELSRLVRARPHEWHVQEANRDAGNTALLLHGAGASTHTWRDILPALARERHVIAVDMPGQGFSRAGTLRRCGLDPMTEDLATLIKQENWRPSLIVGHSAGAALALNLAREWSGSAGLQPVIVGINAALDRFEGIAGWLFPVLAKALALNPVTSLLFTMGGNPHRRAERLIVGTGSEIDARGLDCYAYLIGKRTHVEATLQMMAQWSIDDLLPRLGDLPNRCLFITGDGDRAVPPGVSERAASRLPHAGVVYLNGYGHLVHEEATEEVLEVIRNSLSIGR